MARAQVGYEEVLNGLTMVFRDFGYQGATIGRLCQAAGIKRASLYHYFPNGKEQMVAAVLERSTQIFWETVLPPLQAEGSAAHRINTMLDNLDAYYHSGNVSCLLGVMALDSPNDSIGTQVKAGFTCWIQALAGALEQEGISEGSANARAQDAVIRVQGALILCRGLQQTQPFTRTLALIRRELLEAE